MTARPHLVLGLLWQASRSGQMRPTIGLACASAFSAGVKATSDTTFHVCTARSHALPLQIKIGSVHVFLMGCGLRLDNSSAITDVELVFVARAGRGWAAEDISYGLLHKQPRMDFDVQVVGAPACALLFAQHAIHASCRGESNATGMVRQASTLTVRLRVGREPWTEIPVAHTPRDAAPVLQCTATLLFGSNSKHVAEIAARMRRAWDQLSVRSVSVAFASEARLCGQLRSSVPWCDVRKRLLSVEESTRMSEQNLLGGRPPSFVPHYFEQGPNQQLCLAYGRASRATVVVLTDWDEYPARDLGLVIQHVVAANLAGARLWFDPHPGRYCQQRDYCPRSAKDFEAVCAARRGHPHWKMIANPEHMQSLSVHFSDHASVRDVFGVCLHHHHEVPANFPAILDPRQIEYVEQGKSGISRRARF